MILIDAILALSLGAIFIAIIAGSSLGSKQIFERAHARDKLIDLYESEKAAFDGLMPYQARSIASTSVSAIWYGNDRIETDIDVVATDTMAAAPYEQKLAFKAVRMYPYADLKDAAGTPLCSVDFLKGHSISNASIIPIQLPVNQSVPLTDLQMRDGIAYVSADSSVASDPDLFVFDAHDPAQTRLLSSLNTGPGISAIALAGQRIYAAADSTAAQLHIIRLDSLASPILEKKFKLPLPYATATSPVSSSIFYESGLIYLGTEKWDGDEFDILDISNPLVPNKVGEADIGSKVNSVYVRNDAAYIASANQNQLELMDVHDPAHIWLMNSFSPSGWQRQEGEAIDLFEDTLSFGRTSGGFDIPADREAFTWATTSSANLANPFSMNDPGGVYGIIADRSHIFLGTRQAGKEFKIFDRSLSSTSSSTFPLQASMQSMTCDGDSIYVLGRTSPVMYRITFK